MHYTQITEYYFTLKKKEILARAAMLKIKDILKSEISQLQKTVCTGGFHSHEVPTVVKSIETESRMVVFRGLGARR